MASNKLEYLTYYRKLGSLGEAVQGTFQIKFGKDIRAEMRRRVLFGFIG